MMPIRPTPPDMKAVYVWYAFQERHAAFIPALRSSGLLSEEEKQRHDRFHFREDRDLFLLSHALLRLKLSQCAPPVEPREWQFISTSLGKPEIDLPAAYRGLKFNLTHTRGLASCAIGADAGVGIDVEYLRRSLSPMDLARRFFAAPEVAYLQTRANHELHETFFDIWTLKEAYIKACGTGLFGEPLQTFAMDLSPAPSAAIRYYDQLKGASKDWQFLRYRPGPDHMLALAIHRPGRDDLKILISEADLRQDLAVAK